MEIDISKKIKVYLYNALIVSIAIDAGWKKVWRKKITENSLFGNDCFMNHSKMNQIRSDLEISNKITDIIKNWSGLVTSYAKTISAMSSIHTRMTLPTEDPEDDHQRNGET